MKKHIGIIIAVICMICTAFPLNVMADAAGGGDYNYQYADYWVVVSAWDGYVNFRYGPGLEYGIVYPIYNGEYLHVQQTAQNMYDGLTWGQVSYGGSAGWISLTEVIATGNPYTQPEPEPQPQPEPEPEPQPEPQPQVQPEKEKNPSG
ncbi:MAG: hypothetical protein HUJ76_05295, partial [Parasporobacterium sp.]|nr:hypothetical protein [Parasporobacterium sp.]